MTHHLEQEQAEPRLKGRTALITGASKRVGRALAIALAEEGVNVVAHDRTGLEAETLKVCDEVKACGARSWRITADLERPEEYESLVRRAMNEAGALHILVNNASIFLPSSLMDMSFSDVVRHVQINAWTPLVLSREFSRLASAGAIVNILDTRIDGSDRSHRAYILSKQMLASLTKMCAEEFAPGVRVNGVAPGLILPPAGRDEHYLDDRASTVPLKRHGGSQDVIDAVLYLISADYVTGEIIHVDGGRHLREYDHG